MQSVTTHFYSVEKDFFDLILSETRTSLGTARDFPRDWAAVKAHSSMLN